MVLPAATRKTFRIGVPVLVLRTTMSAFAGTKRLVTAPGATEIFAVSVQDWGVTIAYVRMDVPVLLIVNARFAVDSASGSQTG